ncbi:MAG: HAMP domain-containing histidine kinase [gamma proteobacterium symbiont of Bathyaustriella thionipta]|nr:HAMP domain-containing histidine kinase [gamma proteobacterium symbiont of Bathyaustriella thionipta]MCU7950005.1 HAMP domain-containing histidine kinase [gamma proteobacterium symbiont of Bathyaustriella thionipta]MCU7953804.1 HAMP domain-containing histidine kinase [gamma proteobacterium symbiont of Bathyaustriella thionipta]MCU7956601.1 HAMP domain-containing histidine kinase [gamma proteobacterium symbiont of Bathyaustriella thionipta]MCU7968607.1 HAMP domain-containing histidine kinase 
MGSTIDGKEWAEIAGRESGRMGRLLEDILLYSKPVQLELTLINLVDFLNEFMSTNKCIGESKSLLLDLQLKLSNGKQKHSDSENHLLVKADSDRLNQILLNIYRNAVEAADDNTTIQCRLSNNPEARTVTLVINNQGDVIPDDILQRIGEPFFTTKNRGTGLGMGIVKRMVEAHSGNLSISSSAEEGTNVTITLPYLE